MLKVKSHRQTPGFCGPAALKMVLGFYGLEKGERTLARLAGATRKFGVDAPGLIRAAERLGFRAWKKEHATFADIRRYVIHQKMPVIVDWFSADEGHYSVVVHLDQQFIYLRDPEWRRVRRMRREDFRRVWFDFSTDYIKKKSDLELRRMIIVQPAAGV